MPRRRSRPGNAGNFWPDDPAELFGVAHDLALCGPLVAVDAGSSSTGSQSGRRKYADSAIDTLRQAIVHGLKDVQRLRTDPGFDSLRARDDFQIIVLDLAFPANPFVP